MLKQEAVIVEAEYDRSDQHSVAISPNQSLEEFTELMKDCVKGN